MKLILPFTSAAPLLSILLS